MDCDKPSEIDITAPATTAFIFKEVNRRDWYLRLSALAKELPYIDFKFAQVSRGYPLDTRSKLRLARVIAKAEVVSKYSACPNKWDDITDNFVSDGYAVAVLDLVLDVLAQEKIHLIPRSIETGPAKDLHLAGLSSGKEEQSCSENNIPNVTAGETGVIPFLARFVGCVLGSFLGVLLGHWLFEGFLTENPSQIYLEPPRISAPAFGEIEKFDLPELPLPADQPDLLVVPVRPMEVE